MNHIGEIGADELVFNNDPKNGIYSGGFDVNSLMLKGGVSPIMTLNSDQTGGDKVSNLFESLVIPSWVLSYGNKMDGGKYNDHDSSDESDIDDDLHDKLLDLVRQDEANMKKNKKIKKTKKHKLNSKSETKKNK
jgi:hypothetical protein